MELLNSHAKKLKLMDVREFVRLITEYSGDETTDFNNFMEFMPQDKKDAVQADIYQL